MKKSYGDGGVAKKSVGLECPVVHPPAIKREKKPVAILQYDVNICRRVKPCGGRIVSPLLRQPAHDTSGSRTIRNTDCSLNWGQGCGYIESSANIVTL